MCSLHEFHSGFADAGLFRIAFEIANHTFVVIDRLYPIIAIEAESGSFFKTSTVDNQLFGVGRQRERCLKQWSPFRFSLNTPPGQNSQIKLLGAYFFVNFQPRSVWR